MNKSVRMPSAQSQPNAKKRLGYLGFAPVTAVAPPRTIIWAN